jgi:hypothetical protein
MATGMLEKCALHGWIPVSTVPGRWHRVGEGFANVIVVKSALWWGYGLGRYKLWTTNTIAFNRWHLNIQRYRSEILKPIVVIHCHHLMGSRVAQRSKALHLSVCSITTVPGLNPGCITSGRDWESHTAAHNWPSVVWLWQG